MTFATNINQQIGGRIKLAREKAGLTMAEVGKHFDYTAQAVETWESGKRAISAEKLARIARLLKVKVGWLYGDPA